MRPVEKVLGAVILPALVNSLAAKMDSVSFEGSWTVVTPNANLA